MEEALDVDIEMLENIYGMVAEFLVRYSFQVLGAIIILIIGWLVARWFSAFVVRFCDSKNVDVTLAKFIGSIIYLLVLACFVIIALGKFGISVAPFVAALGALTLGAGLALQGPVSNYGAGFIIILTRPFVVGNTISVSGISGVVEEVRLGMTLMRTEDDEVIVVPNRHLIGEVLYNSFESKIIEDTVGIAYGSDTDAIIQALQEGLAALDCIAESPELQVGIDNFGDSSINIGVRYWVPSKGYFSHKYRANAMIYKLLQDMSVSIPFPQREVRILEQ
ncbi:mechanosensitive ion channel family protein [Candidatus Litorirhabdus singularis]|nr:mechanosensitive ion channel domain-containing protein [Candidatus Litorirhabdus singularis]